MIVNSNEFIRFVEHHLLTNASHNEWNIKIDKMHDIGLLDSNIYKTLKTIINKNRFLKGENMKTNNCPYCGGKTEVRPFIYNVAELPKPIKLFGSWSLIKMRYREIPVKYTVDCVEFCDGFLESQDFSIGDTAEEAIEKWNDICDEKVKR